MFGPFLEAKNISVKVYEGNMPELYLYTDWNIYD